MTSILLGILSTVWLVTCVRQVRQGRGSGPPAIGVLPIALLFVTVPSVVGILQLIRGFQQMAEQGAGGVAAIAPFCLAIPRAVRWGAIAMLVTTVAAAALQAWASPDDSGEMPTDSRSMLAAMALAMSSTLLLPVALEADLVRRVPGLVSQGAVRTMTQPEIADLSRAISRQSVLAMIGGVALTAVLFVSGLVNLVAICRAKSPAWMWKYSWFALAAAILLAAWLIVGTTADIDALERALR